MRVAKGMCKKADPSKFKSPHAYSGSLKWHQEEFADATLGNLWPGFCFDCDPSYKKLKKDELPTVTHAEEIVTKDGDEDDHNKVEDHKSPIHVVAANGNVEPGAAAEVELPMTKVATEEPEVQL